MDFTDIVRQLSLAAIPILVAVTFHEAAHGFVAYKCGDPTAKMLGRMTLNPIAHIDPFGTIVMPLLLFIISKGTFIFGSAKPVPVTYENLKKPRRDSALISASGPGANILIAFISILMLAIGLKFAPGSEDGHPFSEKVMTPVMIMLDYSVRFNMFLAAFNLLPIPPLDGSRIVASVLPPRYAYQFGKLEPYGMVIILLLWFTGIAGYIIAPIQLFIRFLLNVLLIPFGGLV